MKFKQRGTIIKILLVCLAFFILGLCTNNKSIINKEDIQTKINLYKVYMFVSKQQQAKISMSHSTDLTSNIIAKDSSDNTITAYTLFVDKSTKTSMINKVMSNGDIIKKVQKSNWNKYDSYSLQNNDDQWVYSKESDILSNYHLVTKVIRETRNSKYSLNKRIRTHKGKPVLCYTRTESTQISGSHIVIDLLLEPATYKPIGLTMHSEYKGELIEYDTTIEFSFKWYDSNQDYLIEMLTNLTTDGE